MISDCFHMLSKKNCNLLSTEIMLAIFSLHLFQVGGKGRENVHETTSHCSRLSLPKSPGAHFEIHQSVLYLYSPESAQNRSNSQHTYEKFLIIATNLSMWWMFDWWLWSVCRWCLCVLNISLLRQMVLVLQ